MTTFKCTFRGRVGVRDEIRAEVYFVSDRTKPGVPLNKAEQIVMRNVPNFQIKGYSVRRVTDLEHTMIRIHRFHRVLEGEIQDNGTVSPIAPLAISADEAGSEDGEDIIDADTAMGYAAESAPSYGPAEVSPAADATRVTDALRMTPAQLEALRRRG